MLKFGHKLVRTLMQVGHADIKFRTSFASKLRTVRGANTLFLKLGGDPPCTTSALEKEMAAMKSQATSEKML